MEVIQEKSWFQRNWKWFVPTVGCGTIILLFVFGVVGLVFGVKKFISESTPAKYAMEKAIESQPVIKALGEPIEQNGIASGELNFNNSNGDADLAIPIEGPNGKATIYVVATRTDGEWLYSDLYVWIQGKSETINLLDPSLEDR
jgi:hypothetical protein